MSLAIQRIDQDEESSPSQARVRYDDNAVVVVGAGPVGMCFADELLKKTGKYPVVVYGSEPWKPYDRVRLSSYLAGDVGREELELGFPGKPGVHVEMRLDCAVQSIDRQAGTITDALGNVQHYSHLVLAVGSRPFIPSIDNIHYDGVFTFRSLSEADTLFARRMKSQHTIVVGGGLLGLETARAMQRHNTRITLIEHNQWLMMQQLDKRGADFLKSFVENNGVYVELGDSVVSILGKDRVEAVRLRSGRDIACDTVIVAAGIRPNSELAQDCGLACRKGVVVNNHLETSDGNIYAIGECAEHNNNVYGLVKPGLEQAAVLADRLSGGNAQYIGSLESTRLKVMKQTVFSAGRTGTDEASAGCINEFVYSSNDGGTYRKIRMLGNRLIGVIAVGDWHETSLLQDAIQKKKRLGFWHLARFKSSGNVWGSEEDMDVMSWPAAAVVCNCTGATRGRLTQAITSGCESIACLSAETRAASVCGSCKPLLAELLGEDIRVEPVRSWRSLLAVSAFSLCLVALFIFIWRIPYADTVQVSVRWDELWRSSLLKQISGFTMLGLMFAGLAVSLRKRIRKIELGDFNLWRHMHVVIGVCALAALIIHTGFRLGDQLNLLLMLNFLVLVIAGANASTVVATEHRMSPALAKKQRRQWTWLHIMLFWPVPVLLGAHVVKSYYF
jgi:nitrite reductase (NADH) large subunit